MAGIMQLGDLRWRVDPSSVDWTFQMDTAVINTLGGQVIQLLGTTLSDLTISGDFGQDHHTSIVSWRLAAAFHKKIKQMMDRQTLPAKSDAQSTAKGAQQAAHKKGILTDAGQIHDPYLLRYHDGVHNWRFKVLIKGLADGDGSGSIDHQTGKFSYSYQLTLFVVQADSTEIKKVATDYFLTRISDGLGWSQTKYNAPPSAADAQQFITINGGIAGLLGSYLSGSPLKDPTVTVNGQQTANGDSTSGNERTQRGLPPR